jgi:hypothetical protein
VQELDSDELTEMKDLLAFLRESVCAPRDLGEVPALLWRAYTSWLAAEVRKLQKKKLLQAADESPKTLRSRY